MDPHPTLEDFLTRIASLTDQEARVLAELARIPDWRLGNKVKPAMMIPIPGRGSGYRVVADESSEATIAAIDRATAAIGPGAVAAARTAARDAIASRSPTWRGEAIHRPLGIVRWAALVVTLGAMAVSTAVDGAVRDAALYLGVGAILVFALSMFGWYMLPPSLAHLRIVVNEAAIGHAAAGVLDQADVEQLTGGWYAVLEGRWKPYPRPYGLWAIAIVFLFVVVILFLVVPPLAREMGIEG